MGEFDVDAIILETIRRQAGNDAVAPKSRFVEDLHLSENGRRTLFAFMVEACSARGLNLPARGFFLSDFLQCSTPAEVQAEIRATLNGTRKKPSARPKAPTPSAAAPAASALGMTPVSSPQQTAASKDTKTSKTAKNRGSAKKGPKRKRRN